MGEPLYPKEPSKRDPHLDRPWRLDCNLVYGGDGGGWVEEWSKGYRTLWGARIAAWWHYHIASWGGSVSIARRDDGGAL